MECFGPPAAESGGIRAPTLDPVRSTRERSSHSAGGSGQPSWKGRFYWLSRLQRRCGRVRHRRGKQVSGPPFGVLFRALLSLLVRRESLGAGLRRSILGFAVSRPPLLRGFPYRLQTGSRELPFLGLRRCCGLRLLLLLRRPSRPLCGGDPGAARLADRAALLRTRMIRSGRRGYRGLWPAWTGLTELRFDIGDLR